MTHRNFAVIASVVLVAACSQQGAAYRVPVAEARQILMATDLPPFVFGSQLLDCEARADGDSKVVWIVRRNDAELFRYVAHLSKAGDDATRVKVELLGAQGGPEGDVARKLRDHPRIRDLYLVAMKERVASALERRPFEMSRLYPAMTVAMVANMGSTRASLNQAAAASEQLERENIAKAYRDEASGARR